MGRRIDPSWSGPIKLFLVPASVPTGVHNNGHELPYLWDGADKRFITGRVAHKVAAVGFLSHSLTGSLPYI